MISRPLPLLHKQPLESNGTTLRHYVNSVNLIIHAFFEMNKAHAFLKKLNAHTSKSNNSVLMHCSFSHLKM